MLWCESTVSRRETFVQTIETLQKQYQNKNVRGRKAVSMLWCESTVSHRET